MTDPRLPPMPAPRPQIATRPRVLVTVDVDGVRAVDVELSAAVMRRGSRGLLLRPDERPAEVDPPWTPEELSAVASQVLGEVDRVPPERGASVVEDASRVGTHLRERYPQIAEDALDDIRHDFCLKNR